ncbi:MAG TPA: DUF4199 domain-containing protein [Chitinophagales bacterium]|nr:DUF4199 domain-containing protein [Chitinophagales bacterium]
MKPDFKVAVRYGVIGALVMIIISVLSYLFYQNLFDSFFMQIATGFLFFALFVFIPVWGGVTFKRANGGVVSFKNAFIGVIIICAITSAGSNIMQYLIPNVLDTQYPEELVAFMKKTTADYMEKMGAPDEKVDEVMKNFTIEKFKPSALKTLESYGIALAFSAVLSLIIAAFLARKDKTPTAQATDSGTSA